MSKQDDNNLIKYGVAIGIWVATGIFAAVSLVLKDKE